mmetsp:Transcript_10305/g.30646  ORF Transcript_10305/g.30646 Transcript_10305/m.30646 type:complete len:292 (-) Transcript_10305:558-1433(-)
MSLSLKLNVDSGQGAPERARPKAEPNGAAGRTSGLHRIVYLRYGCQPAEEASEKSLKVQHLGHRGGGLGRAVRALEPDGAASAREFRQRAEREHVAARQQHGRVSRRGRLLGDGARKDGVVHAVRRGQLELNRELAARPPHVDKLGAEEGGELDQPRQHRLPRRHAGAEGRPARQAERRERAARRLLRLGGRGGGQDEVAVAVAGRLHDAGDALLGDGEEGVARGGGSDRVDGRVRRTCPALESDRRGETRGELAVGPGACLPRADERVRREVGHELRRDGVDVLDGGGQA